MIFFRFMIYDLCILLSGCSNSSHTTHMGAVGKDEAELPRVEGGHC